MPSYWTKLGFILLASAELINGYCTQDMQNLVKVARADSQGRRPDGRCYSHVADYIDKVGYGGIAKNGFNNAIPSQYWAEARQFAEYLNAGGASKLGLQNIGGNPYNAPAGAIVVVRAGTPGTAHPTAGDISVADSGKFWNGGDMGFGGSSTFNSGNYVLGVYVPTKCSGMSFTSDEQMLLDVAEVEKRNNLRAAAQDDSDVDDDISEAEAESLENIQLASGCDSECLYKCLRYRGGEPGRKQLCFGRCGC